MAKGMTGRVGRKTALVWATALLLLWAGLSPAADLVVVSEHNSPLHRQFVEQLSRAPALASLRTVQVDVEHADLRTTVLADEPRLVVTVGKVAAERLAYLPGPPVFHLLVSHSQFDHLYPDGYPSGRRGALFIDQPFSRQFALVRAVLPQARRIGYLYSSMIDENTIAQAEEAAARQRFFLSGGRINGDNLAEQLPNILDRVDALITLPDPQVVNRQTIKSLILSAFHSQKPLIGYSAALVKAGALLAVYTSTEDAAGESAEHVVSFFNRSEALAAWYPRRFAVAVNYQVARALGLTVADEESLIQLLRESDDGDA